MMRNRHFFLSHAFRDKYNQALLNYPFINSNIQITRTEVWITNRNNKLKMLEILLHFKILESHLLCPQVLMFL